MAFTVDGASTPNTVNSSVEHTREYLTVKEVEDLMAAARKSSRYGHRDATMILIAYRHGLLPSEICDLQWHQVELHGGRLHVRRSKRGTPSVHPIQGDELRALRPTTRAAAQPLCVLLGAWRPDRCEKLSHADFAPR
jgi:type 1 fimbriae regulatory protein FimB/type 1 fimbriae regulatory protein FimE